MRYLASTRHRPLLRQTSRRAQHSAATPSRPWPRPAKCYRGTPPRPVWPGPTARKGQSRSPAGRAPMPTCSKPQPFLETTQLMARNLKLRDPSKRTDFVARAAAALAAYGPDARMFLVPPPWSELGRCSSQQQHRGEIRVACKEQRVHLGKKGQRRRQGLASHPA